MRPVSDIRFWVYEESLPSLQDLHLALDTRSARGLVMPPLLDIPALLETSSIQSITCEQAVSPPALSFRGSQDGLLELLGRVSLQFKTSGSSTEGNDGSGSDNIAAPELSSIDGSASSDGGGSGGSRGTACVLLYPDPCTDSGTAGRRTGGCRSSRRILQLWNIFSC